jgi:hypothetical protein
MNLRDMMKLAMRIFQQPGFLPVRAPSSTVLVRTGAGGAVPALGWYQVVQYSDCRGTGSTGTETVLLNIEVIAVLCLNMIAFSLNFAVEKAQSLQKTVILDFK